MAGIEIREDCGDVEGLVEFIRRIWISEYAGRMWFSVPDEHTIRRWAHGGGCFAAYHGTKIVGSVFDVPYSLGSPWIRIIHALPCNWSSGFIAAMCSGK
jgi:hypothetical protein